MISINSLHRSPGRPRSSRSRISRPFRSESAQVNMNDFACKETRCHTAKKVMNAVWGVVPFASATATSPFVPSSAARFLHQLRKACVPALPQFPRVVVCRLRGRVGVHLALAAGHDDVHEAAGVCETLLRAALGDLLLLLLLDLCAHATSAIYVLRGRWLCDGGGGERLGWRGGVGGVRGGWRALSCAGGGRVVSYLGGLRLDLTGTRERTVDLTHVGG